MSKRQLILTGTLVTIILLVVLVAVIPQKPKDGVDRKTENFFSDFLSLITNRDRTPGGDSPADPTFISEPDPEDQAKLKLRKISSVPVAGFGVFMNERFVEVPEEQAVEPATSVPTPPATELFAVLRYVDRITGNIYQSPAEAPDERKISTTFIPGVREAFFTRGGGAVFMRYVKPDQKTIATYGTTLPTYTLGGDESELETSGSFLPDNITAMSVSYDDPKVFYIVEGDKGVTGVVANERGLEKAPIFDSPFTEWLTDWPNGGLITLTTKPSSQVRGYLYALNPKNREFEKLLAGVPGLTALVSRNGSSILYGENDLSLKLLDRSNNQVKDLRIRTMPEKCVWSKSNLLLYCAVPKQTESVAYPDAWYQGEVSFSDQIWKIDLFSGAEIAILDPVEVSGGEDIDAVNLQLDENEDYLFFINKKDSFLWQLDLD